MIVNLAKEHIAPAYNDGCFTLYDIVDVASVDAPDFPEKKISLREIGQIGFRELAIYDRTRLTFEQADEELTMKVAIPRWDGIDSSCVCMIGGVQHKVFNCAHVISKQGYPETELTLVKPEAAYEIYAAEEVTEEVTDDDDESTA